MSRADAGQVPDILEMIARNPPTSCAVEHGASSDSLPAHANSNEWHGVRYLVLAEPTEKERDLLRVATDRVLVVMNWIIHDIARLSPDIDAAPPIQSRMYQEL